MDHPSTLLLGASDLSLLPLYQLVASWSAMMVSETSASEDGTLEERLRGAKPSSRSGRPRSPAGRQRRRERNQKLSDGKGMAKLTFVAVSAMIFS